MYRSSTRDSVSQYGRPLKWDVNLMGNDREQCHQPCDERHYDGDDPIQVLLWFRQAMARMNEQLIHFTPNDEFGTFTGELEQIERYQEQIENYLLEECFGTLATYERQTNNVILEHMPDDIQFLPKTDGITISGIPLWMIGHKSVKKLPPIYHRDRPMIRKIPMWQAMIGHLKSSYLRTVLQEDNVLLTKPAGYAHVVFDFHTNQLQVRDLDHYDVAPIINACVSNGLLISDHPSRLSFTMIWNEVSEPPRLDLHVRYLDCPLSLPLDLKSF